MTPHPPAWTAAVHRHIRALESSVVHRRCPLQMRRPGRTVPIDEFDLITDDLDARIRRLRDVAVELRPPAADPSGLPEITEEDVPW